MSKRSVIRLSFLLLTFIACPAILSAQKISAKAVKAAKDQFDANRKRMAALQWTDLIGSEYAEHYRIELERVAYTVEFGTDDSSMMFASIWLRFRYTGKEKQPRLVSRQIKLTEDDALVLIEAARRYQLNQLNWLDADRDALSVRAEEYYYAGQFEYATPKLYSLMLSPCACGSHKKEAAEGGTIFRLKAFTDDVLSSVIDTYQGQINMIVSQIGQQGYELFQYWAKGDL